MTKNTKKIEDICPNCGEKGWENCVCDDYYDIEEDEWGYEDDD